MDFFNNQDSIVERRNVDTNTVLRQTSKTADKEFERT